MAAFETAFAIVLRHEGGFAQNLSDRGGATMYGISTPVLQAWRQKQGSRTQVNPADMKALTIEEATQIYRTQYWNVINGDAIADQRLANAFMDMAVLRGVGAACKSMQTALGVKADGAIGSVTITTLNNTATTALLLRFQSLCINTFVGIVEANPSQLQFLRGWISRALEFTSGCISMNLA